MALLPRVRPKPGSYGRAIKNERPVRNAELEADAIDYNNLRDDVAFMGALTPVARCRVQNDGKIASLAGIAGLEPSLVTVTRLVAGYVRVELAPAVGIVLTDAKGWSNATALVHVVPMIVGPGIVDVRTWSGTIPTDLPFTLELF